MDKYIHSKWLADWMRSQGILLWGAADIRLLCFCIQGDSEPYPGAVSWVIPMPPDIMGGIKNGPTRAYAQAYAEVNSRINEIASWLSNAMAEKEFRAHPLAASDRTDPIHIRGEFPHKTAATLSGVGDLGFAAWSVRKRLVVFAVLTVGAVALALVYHYFVAG